MTALKLERTESLPITVKMTSTGYGNDASTLFSGNLKDGKFVAVSHEDGSNVVFAGVSEGNAVINRMIGLEYEETVELMIRAVNNRTRQRNYFRLYGRMRDGEITEEEFYSAIENNEDDYVVEESEMPTKERLMLALSLCRGMKDVKSSEDVSTLFSFDSSETDRQLEEIDAYGCLQ